MRFRRQINPLKISYFGSFSWWKSVSDWSLSDWSGTPRCNLGTIFPLAKRQGFISAKSAGRNCDLFVCSGVGYLCVKMMNFVVKNINPRVNRVFPKKLRSKDSGRGVTRGNSPSSLLSQDKSDEFLRQKWNFQSEIGQQIPLFKRICRPLAWKAVAETPDSLKVLRSRAAAALRIQKNWKL